jgi:hypothetical protein
MTNRVYTTANGKSIDFGALQLRNEETKAVGNMGVNARGDKIEKNRVVETRSRMVQGQHKRQSRMFDTPPYSSIAEYKREQAQNKAPEPLTKDLTEVSVEDQIAAGDLETADVQAIEEFEPEVVVTPEDVTVLTGLAAALAKTKK